MRGGPRREPPGRTTRGPGPGFCRPLATVYAGTLLGVVHDPAERADGRDLHRSLRLHLARHLGADLRPVLDRVDAGTDAARDPRRADGVRGDRHAPGVRLVDGGLDLLDRERREIDLDAGRQHAARCDDLDRAGAGAHLLAHGEPNAVCAVALPRERVPTVAPRDRERAAGRHDARTRDAAALDGPRHVADDRAEAAEVAHRRRAGPQVSHGVSRALDRGERLGDVGLTHEVRLAVEAQVHMAVDEAGRERAAVPGEVARRLRLAGRARVRAHPLDDAILEQDAGSLARAPAVEHRHVVDVRPGHSAPSAPPPRPASCRSAERSGE